MDKARGSPHSPLGVWSPAQQGTGDKCRAPDPAFNQPGASVCTLLGSSKLGNVFTYVLRIKSNRIGLLDHMRYLTKTEIPSGQKERLSSKNVV